MGNTGNWPVECNTVKAICSENSIPSPRINMGPRVVALQFLFATQSLAWAEKQCKFNVEVYPERPKDEGWQEHCRRECSLRGTECRSTDTMYPGTGAGVRQRWAPGRCMKPGRVRRLEWWAIDIDSSPNGTGCTPKTGAESNQDSCTKKIKLAHQPVREDKHNDVCDIGEDSSSVRGNLLNEWSAHVMFEDC